MKTSDHERNGQPWTGDEDRALVWMRAEGWRWEDVAEALGRSPCACSVRAPVIKAAGRWMLPAEAFEDDALDIEEELVSEPDTDAPDGEPHDESPITEADRFITCLLNHHDAPDWFAVPATATRKLALRLATFADNRSERARWVRAKLAARAA